MFPIQGTFPSKINFDGETILGSAAASMSHSIKTHNQTKKTFYIQFQITLDDTSARDWRMRINGLTTSIYDYEEVRFFTGATSAGGQAQGTTFILLDTSASGVANDHSVYNIMLQRTTVGWHGSVIGSRISSTTHALPFASFFIDTTADLSSVDFLFSAGNLKATDSRIKVWVVDE